MNILNKLKKTKINNNLDFSVSLFWFIDAVDDYFFNYDPKKENQILLMYNTIQNNLTDYTTHTQPERDRKEELLRFFDKGFENFIYRKKNPND